MFYTLACTYITLNRIASVRMHDNDDVNNTLKF